MYIAMYLLLRISCIYIFIYIKIYNPVIHSFFCIIFLHTYLCEKKRKIDQWILNIRGLSGRKYRNLINNLISKLKNPSYLEIGSFTGSTACSAAAKNTLKIIQKTL